MRRKTKKPDADPSPEFKAFEEATKQILKVPKTEIDKRLAEERAAKHAR